MREYRIHPAIGIARLGDSDEYYLAPESPGEVANEGSPYRDAQGKIKRQGQRFRIYEFEDGVAKREITSNEAEITWQVRLTNRKAALRKSYLPACPRNVDEAEADLIIDTGVQDVRPDDTCVLAGNFRLSQAEVVLGTAIVKKEDGRLIVVGAEGRSEGPEPHNGDLDFCNNDGWFDDTADGIVSATLKFAEGDPIPTQENARVLCGPPGFAPGIENVVTLYDAVFQAAIPLDPSLWPPGRLPSFAEDILPLLRRTVRLQWVSKNAALGHGDHLPNSFLKEDQLRLLSDNDPDPQSEAYKRRRTVFLRLTTPSDSAPPTSYPFDPPGQVRNMPALNDSFAVTPFMYRLMRQWSLGQFTNSSVAVPWRPLDQVPLSERPAALDRAALEGATGGPWYPGIETWRVLGQTQTFDKPFRVKEALLVGHLTIGNAVPWQADFQACGRRWWPSQRPNEVSRYVNGQLNPFQKWVTWDRNRDMVDRWKELGFIVRHNGEYVELERSTGGGGVA